MQGYSGWALDARVIVANASSTVRSFGSVELCVGFGWILENPGMFVFVFFWFWLICICWIRLANLTYNIV